MDQHRSELHTSNWRMGRLIADSGVKVFQIETTLNTDTFPDTFRFLQKREWEWKAKDRLGFLATSAALDRMPARYARQIFHSVRAPHRMTSVQAGEVEAVHAITTENVWDQQGVVVEGQTDILTMGLPYISPYNVNSIMNPILVACLGLGYFFNLYRGTAAGPRGRGPHHDPPDPVGVQPRPPPELHRLLRAGAERDDRPRRGGRRFEEGFATDPWYIHLYRTGHAYHGVHPFYMWYWCAHALEHLGAVIIVGGDPKAVHRLGFRAGLDPGRRPGDGPGRRRPLPHPHPPARPADPHGRRAVSPTRDSSRTLRSRRGVRTDAALGDAAAGAAPAAAPSARWLGPGAGAAAFPLAAPTWPGSVPRPAPEPELGVHYDTAWSRRYPVRLARAVVLDNVTRPLARAVASPQLRGDEGLVDLEAPVIFAANHASHIDTPLLLACLPLRFRHRTVVAAAADYFFDRRWKADTFSFAPGGHPHRTHQGQPAVGRPGRRAAGRRLEPGHLPRGRAVARRLGPGVPRRRRLPGRHAPGGRWSRPPRRDPAHPAQGRAAGSSGRAPRSPSGRRCGRPRARTPAGSPTRIEAAVATLADESTTDWWTARKAAAAGTTPSLQGPDVAPWRRAWALAPAPERAEAIDAEGNDWPRTRN